MKTIHQTTLILILALMPTFAGDDHPHDKILAGPKGGRVLELGSRHAEFFVQPDKRAAVYLYDGEMKAVAPEAQEVVLIAEAPAGKSKVEFERTADGFLSKTAIPEGESYRMVLQIRETSDAKPQNFRIDYNSAVCGGCQRAEYACVCGH